MNSRIKKKEENKGKWGGEEEYREEENTKEN
jgi:hypothetical protein